MKRKNTLRNGASPFKVQQINTCRQLAYITVVFTFCLN